MSGNAGSVTFASGRFCLSMEVRVSLPDSGNGDGGDVNSIARAALSRPAALLAWRRSEGPPGILRWRPRITVYLADSFGKRNR